MNILEAFIIFDILIIIYEILVSFFSAIFEVFGLAKDEARFQVTSLLTGTGFTTSESEKMLKTKKMKRITRDIMIISYIFNISIISTLVALFTSANEVSFDELLIGLSLSIIVLILLLFSKKITWVREKIDNFFLKIAKFLYKNSK